MTMSLTTDLRRHGTWDPAQLLAASFRWPTSHPLVPLRDITTLISPEALVTIGAEVITPVNLDPTRGNIRRRSRRYQGTAHLVGGSLQPGDILIARSPRVPVLRIEDPLRGAAVSADFVALRPDSNLSSLWLWGALNSRSGQKLRGAMAAGGSIPRLNRTDIEALEVPLPPLSVQHEMQPQLAELEATTMAADEEPATWWRIADLRGTDWRFETTLRDSDVLNRGVPLETLCHEIVQGKTSLKAASEVPRDGYLPVIDIAVLHGGAPTRWVPSDDDKLVVAAAGDVLVPVVGERAHALVASESAAVHENVYALRLHDPSLGTALAQFLRSTEGFRLRQILLSGAVIPRMRKADLGRTPIPSWVLTSPMPEPPPVESLADRLERILWPC